jgi:hypothetical protein
MKFIEEQDTDDFEQINVLLKEKFNSYDTKFGTITIDTKTIALLNLNKEETKSLFLTQENNNNISDGLNINTAMTTRIGKDLYFGTENYDEDQIMLKKRIEKLFPDYRCHVINTGGHSDGTFCPVVPGLIVSLHDVPSYVETFPDWEVVYLPGQSWPAVKTFLDLKDKNKGKWWVPGEELNDDFTDFV